MSRSNIPAPVEFALDDIRAVAQSNGSRHVQRVHEFVTAGLMTKPVKIGRSSRWPRHEHQAIAAARIAGANDDEIRELVAELHDLRRRLLPNHFEAA